MTFCFVHTADVHFDSPLATLSPCGFVLAESIAHRPC